MPLAMAGILKPLHQPLLMAPAPLEQNLVEIL